MGYRVCKTKSEDTEGEGFAVVLGADWSVEVMSHFSEDSSEVFSSVPRPISWEGSWGFVPP